jgi:hypothetical protein
MTDARREALQWFALLGGPAAWTAHLVLGFGYTEASCGSGLRSVGLDRTAAVSALTVAAALVTLLAELAAVALFRELRDVDPDAPGPDGRRRFLAFGAMVGNVLLFVAIILAGVANLAHAGCPGS